MVTTIKVSEEVRDRLKEQAAIHGRTIGEQIAELVARAERDERFARLRRQIAATPAAERDARAAEIAAWQEASGDGLPADDFRAWPGYAEH
ncbi:MAG: DNA mismatch repair protein MutS [Leifsonia xyli]|nr:MAG: DNA mismatch repair protein MutS [Leifsonia xyli]